MSNAAPLRRNLVTPLTVVLAALTLIAFYFVALRFIYGLGAVTNLNQGYPWGIWVVIDIFIGTALGCGGFAMAILVYVFNGTVYHPLMRPALLGGVFGYTLGGLALIVDLGRYWQVYNFLLPWHWQPNSIMFEVGLCMLAYTAVVWIEFAPAILERLGWIRLKRLIERWMFVFIALGILLPLMHQSSFGTVLLAMSTKLSPLWLTVWLPLLFVVSAILMGYSVVMLEAAVVTQSFDLPSEHQLLSRLSRVVGWLTVAWLVVRWADLIGRGAADLAFAGDLKATMFWIENVLFAGGALVFLTPSGRASRRASFLAAAALLAAGALYRIDAFLVGVTPVGNWGYFPSVAEIMVTVGIISFEILLYLVVIKTFPVLESASRSGTAHA
ncbi:MAG TPA: Ni/Fe-hydrogenase cytochrome b subunit [Xanthobacteraceae bacterium]|nr:Ni/Fe-hydrogenase cytochrome b subunit [Xanthobacteraceae bacterium]